MFFVVMEICLVAHTLKNVFWIQATKITWIFLMLLNSWKQNMLVSISCVPCALQSCKIEDKAEEKTSGSSKPSK